MLPGNDSPICRSNNQDISRSCKTSIKSWRILMHSRYILVLSNMACRPENPPTLLRWFSQKAPFASWDSQRQMLHGAGIWIPTFARTKSASFVGKYTSTMGCIWVSPCCIQWFHMIPLIIHLVTWNPSPSLLFRETPWTSSSTRRRKSAAVFLGALAVKRWKINSKPHTFYCARSLDVLKWTCMNHMFAIFVGLNWRWMK